MQRLIVLVVMFVLLVGGPLAAQSLVDTITSDDGLAVSHPAGWFGFAVPGYGFIIESEAGWEIEISVGEGAVSFFNDPDPMMPAAVAVREVAQRFDGGTVDPDAPTPVDLLVGPALQLQGTFEMAGTPGAPMVALVYNLPDGRLVTNYLYNDVTREAISDEAYADFIVTIGSLIVTGPPGGSIPAGAVAVADMEPGTLQFSEGVQLTLPEGWDFYSTEPYVTNTAIIYQGESYLSSNNFALVTINDNEQVPMQFYIEFLLGMTAMLYTGREDFDAERDILTETLEDGRELLYLDVSDAEELIGNAIFVPLDDAFYSVFIATVLAREEDRAAIIEGVFEAARSITRTAPEVEAVDAEDAQIIAAPEIVDTGFSLADFDLTPETITCGRYVSLEDVNPDAPFAVFECPANCASDYYSVWGTDIYTLDSAICAAAIHAGALTDAAGGFVLLTWQPGQTQYPGSQRNGITTSEWGEWGDSFIAEAFDPATGERR